MKVYLGPMNELEVDAAYHDPSDIDQRLNGTRVIPIWLSVTNRSSQPIRLDYQDLSLDLGSAASATPLWPVGGDTARAMLLQDGRYNAFLRFLASQGNDYAGEPFSRLLPDDLLGPGRTKRGYVFFVRPDGVPFTGFLALGTVSYKPEMLRTKTYEVRSPKTESARLWDLTWLGNRWDRILYGAPPFNKSYALLLGEKGDTAQAARQLRTLLKQTAGDREIYLDLAQVYERGRWFAEAEQAAQEAEKLSTQPADSETVWFLLGAIYERQKKFDQAEEQFRRALAVNPRNAPVLNYYGYMLADRGVRLDESVALVERALAEDPHNGAYLDSLGWAFFKQGRLPEAETYLRKAVARQGSDPTIREHLGEVFYKTGRHDLAAAEWEKALAAWKRVLPSESEAERVAELEKKLAGLKHRLAQQKPGGEAKPQ